MPLLLTKKTKPDSCLFAGFFHWDRNMGPLAEATGQEVWTMDYLGQGDSWPVACDDGNAPSEQGLQYSADGWLEQTIEFIETVVRALEL